MRTDAKKMPKALCILGEKKKEEDLKHRINMTFVNEMIYYSDAVLRSV